MNEKGTAGGSGASAAAWFVAIDAGQTDAGAEARFASWLAADPDRETALARCEAALALTKHLGDAAKLANAFDEAARLAGGTDSALPPRQRPTAGTDTALPRRRRLALRYVAGLAATAALVVAVFVTLEHRTALESTPRPTAASATPSSGTVPLPQTLAFDVAGAESAVYLPGPVVVDARSVAVLPFVAVAPPAGAGEGGGLAASLHDEIVRQLESIPGVYVLDRTAVAPYAGGDTDPGLIATQLGVRGIVEARVTEVGGRVQVVLRLTDAARAGPPIQDAFERPVDELGAMRTEIVTNIARALADTPVPPAYVPPLR